ncbi:hypothetical protein TMPK1_07880 [Rhodospirillales bacterium TMPK1]|uniref:Uncharacterized protein n=1 Tax=Roseiterribacter gracilis TaxID=2812848 RepID=A0A8S8X9I3_9PROT|nr:hypothetical protein TMPK1_07880 [Rhodospirillales bacterium TMPK1]
MPAAVWCCAQIAGGGCESRRDAMAGGVTEKIFASEVLQDGVNRLLHACLHNQSLLNWAEGRPQQVRVKFGKAAYAA